MNKNTSQIIFSALALLALGTPALAESCAQERLVLTVGKHVLALKPTQPACASAGTKFVIKVEYLTDLGGEPPAITVRQKSDQGHTVTGDNSRDPAWLKPEVDADADVDDEIEYWIDVDGVGRLDPRVRVIRQLYNPDSELAEYDLALQKEIGLSLFRLVQVDSEIHALTGLGLDEAIALARDQHNND